MRLFSMLDEITQGEVMLAMQELLDELERETAEVARLQGRLDAARAWRQTLRRNTRCWATLENLAFLESHEGIALETRGMDAAKASKHHFRPTLGT
jgi:hypothetical protein